MLNESDITSREPDPLEIARRVMADPNATPDMKALAQKVLAENDAKPAGNRPPGSLLK